MKVTVSRLKEIIKEELQKETLSPMDFSAGRDPAVSQTPDMMKPPETELTSEEPAISSLQSLFYAILHSPDKRLSATVELSEEESSLLAGMLAQANPQE
tara:strand:+ start:662 stop:958 length:297 start_codon:yes stop_codon:yes gene_type:complete